ncbi:uncharacterized protein ARMOST_14634 [Armillaria ostoyae]|uniref:Uncharacterized protein n=1 Tax=Armillaria ostoyae TaxID=47428 RepID=A0A284RR48_ARMOS|nr:uncharacterized protein ARMOST_14634 [Armillaria ostoyae]
MTLLFLAPAAIYPRQHLTWQASTGIVSAENTLPHQPPSPRPFRGVVFMTNHMYIPSTASSLRSDKLMQGCMAAVLILDLDCGQAHDDHYFGNKRV